MPRNDSCGRRAAEGLPADSVTAIIQTRDGFLWVGTSAGLVRFDGVKFTVFNRRNTKALRDNNIVALTSAPDDSLWIGYAQGGAVSRLMSDGSIRHYQIFPSSPARDIQIQGSGASRKVLVGFQSPAAVYVFSDRRSSPRSHEAPHL